MIKFLPIGVLILLIIFVGGYLWIKRSESQPTPQVKQLATISGSTDVNTFAPVSSDDRIKILEDAVIVLAKKINGEVPTTGTNANLISRISTLEDKVTSLQKQVSQLQGGTANNTIAQTTPTTAKKSPIFIPLGWVASSSGMDWATISSQSVIIDTGDYPGLTSVQFEARIGNYQGNGTAYARLINSTSGNAILGSQVSANGADYTWTASSNFPLSSGKNTYALQLKTNTGYNAQISDAHLKINF